MAARLQLQVPSQQTVRLCEFQSTPAPFLVAWAGCSRLISARLRWQSMLLPHCNEHEWQIVAIIILKHDGH